MGKRFEREPRKKDLYLARVSILAITIGFGIMGIAPVVGLTMFGNFRSLLPHSGRFGIFPRLMLVKPNRNCDLYHRIWIRHICSKLDQLPNGANNDGRIIQHPRPDGYSRLSLGGPHDGMGLSVGHEHGWSLAGYAIPDFSSLVWSDDSDNFPYPSRTVRGRWSGFGLGIRKQYSPQAWKCFKHFSSCYTKHLVYIYGRRPHAHVHIYGGSTYIHT